MKLKFQKKQHRGFLEGFVVLLLFLSSCKINPSSTDDEAKLPASVVANQILDEFIIHSNKYGYNFKKENVAIELTDEIIVGDVSYCGASLNYAGLIKIDTTTACWITGFANQEQIIYHELGHYFLLQGHTDHWLSDSKDKGSIMHPFSYRLYTEVEHELRDYYISQLFDAATIPPSVTVTGLEWEIGEFKNGDFKDGIQNWKILEQGLGYEMEFSEEVFSGESPSLRMYSSSNQSVSNGSVVIDQIFKIERDVPLGSVIELSFDAWIKDTNYGDIESLHNVIAVRFSSQDYDPNPSFLFRKDFVAETDGFQNYKLTVPYYIPFDDSISVRLGMANGVQGEVYFDNFKLTVKEP